MAKQTKFHYLRVMQEQLEDGTWCDAEFAHSNDPEEMRSLRSDIKSYRGEGIRIRVVSRRVPNDGRKLSLSTI